jgi:hypothetical protein
MCTESSLFGTLGFGEDRIARCWEHAHGRLATGTAFGAGLSDLIGDVRRSMQSVWETIDCIREDEAYVRQSLIPALMDSGELFTEPGVMDPDRTLERLGPALRLARDAGFKQFSRRTRQRQNVIFANNETLVRAYDTATRKVLGARNASGAVVPTGAKSMADVRSDFDATFAFGSSSWLDDAAVATFAVIQDNRVLIALGMFALVTAYCMVMAGKSPACELMHRIYTCVTGGQPQPHQQQGFGTSRRSPVRLLESASLRPMLEHFDGAHPDVSKLMRRLALASDGTEREGWVAALHAAKMYVDATDKKDDAQKRMLLAVRTESREHLESVLQRIGVLVDTGLDPAKPDEYTALCAAADEPLRGLRVLLGTLEAYYAGQSLEWTVGIGAKILERHTHSFGAIGILPQKIPPQVVRRLQQEQVRQQAATKPTPQAATKPTPQAATKPTGAGSGGSGAETGGALLDALGSVGDVLFGDGSRAKLTSAEVNGAKFRAAILVLALLLSIYIHPMMGITVVACGSVAFLIYNYIETVSVQMVDKCRNAGWFDPSWLADCFFIYTTNALNDLAWAKYGLAVAGAVWVYNLLRPLIPMDDDEAAYADHAMGMISGAADTAATFHKQINSARRKSNIVLARVAAKAVGAGVTAATGGDPLGARGINSVTDMVFHDDEEEEDQDAAPAQGQAQGRVLRQGKERMLV